MILVLISLPFFYSFKFKYKDSFQYEIQLNIACFKLKYSKFKQHNKQQKTAKEKTINKKNESKIALPLKIITKNNIEHVLKFLSKIFKHIKPDKANLDLLLSFSYLYYNGLILAYYLSLKNFYPALPLEIIVDWEQEVIEGQGMISGKIVPLVFFYHLLIFIISPQFINIIWEIYKYKK